MIVQLLYQVLKERKLVKFAYAQHHWMKSWIPNNHC